MPYCRECNETSIGAYCSLCGGNAGSDVFDQRPITILASDILGSTRIAQELTLEESSLVMRRYHELLEESCVKFGGFVAQVAGDDFLACFGYPEVVENSCEKAVEAAKHALRKFSVERFERGYELTARIAVHHGSAALFYAPNGELQFGGTAPIVATRMQQFAPDNAVLVSGSVAERVNSKYVLKPLGSLSLKGLSRTVESFEIGEMLRATDSSSKYNESTKLIGREGVIDELLMWAKSMEPQQPILLSGEPGVGKTRLISEFCELVRETALFYTCADARNPSSFEVIWGLLHLLLKVDTRSAVAERLAHDPSIKLTVGLEKLLGIESTGSGIDGVSVGEVASLIRAVLVHEGTQLMIIDNIHFADAASLQVIEDLAVDDVPKILITTRPGPERLFDWANVVNLEPLGMDHTQELLESLSFVPIGTGLASKIYGQTAGNALYIEQLAYALADDETGAAPLIDAGREDFAAPTELREFPDSLADLLVGRINRLGGAARTLRAASALGGEFHEAMLGRVVGADSDSIRSDLRLLVSKRLLRRKDTSNFEFCHGLIQDAAYATLLINDRRDLHNKVARELELENAESHVIAHHWEHGAQFTFAIEKYSDASENSLALGLQRDALNRSEHALQLLADQPPSSWRDETKYSLLLLQGNAISLLEGYGSPRRLAITDEALELSEVLGGPGGELVPLVYARWTYYLARSDHSAREWCDKLAAFAGQDLSDLPEQFEMTALFVEGTTRFMEGRVSEAVESLESAAKLYRESHHRPLLRLYGENQGLYASVWLQWAYVHSGQINESLIQSRKSETIASRIGDPFSLLLAMIFEMHIQNEMENYEATVAVADKILATAKEYGLDYYMSIATGSKARVLLLEGQVQYLDQALQSWKELEGNDHTNMSIIVHRDLTKHFISSADYQRADFHICEAERIVGETLESLFLPEVRRLRALWLEAQGQLPAALETYQEALDAAMAQGAYFFAVKAGVNLAQLQLEQEGKSEALASCEAWKAYCQRGDCATYDSARKLLDWLAS